MPVSTSISQFMPQPDACGVCQDFRNELTIWLNQRLPELLRLPVFSLPPDVTPKILEVAWSQPIAVDGDLLGVADLWVVYATLEPHTRIYQAALILDPDILYTADLIRRLRLYEWAFGAAGERCPLIVVTAAAEEFDLEILPQQGFGVLHVPDWEAVEDYETPVGDLVEAYPVTYQAYYERADEIRPGLADDPEGADDRTPCKSSAPC